MKKRHDSRPYTIHMSYGDSDLIHIIDDLAKQTIHKNDGDFGVSYLRGKKSKHIRRAI